MRFCCRFLLAWQHATVVLSDKRNHDKSQQADRISGIDGEVRTMLFCVRRRPKPVDKDAKPCLTGQEFSSLLMLLLLLLLLHQNNNLPAVYFPSLSLYLYQITGVPLGEFVIIGK